MSKLLDFVKDIKQGGLTPTAVSTGSAALAPGKLSRKECSLANQAKRAEKIDTTSTGTLPPPPPLLTASERVPPPARSDEVPDSELLDMT